VNTGLSWAKIIPTLLKHKVMPYDSGSQLPIDDYFKLGS